VELRAARNDSATFETTSSRLSRKLGATFPALPARLETEGPLCNRFGLAITSPNAGWAEVHASADLAGGPAHPGLIPAGSNRPCPPPPEGSDRPALTPSEVADTVFGWVAVSLPPLPVKDHAESLLVAAYGRMYRCFSSVRGRAGPPRYEADDARILTRALLSTAVQSLWFVAPDDPAERHCRQRSATLDYWIKQRKIAVEEQAAGNDVGDGPERLARNIEVMKADGVAEQRNEHDFSVALNMKAFYTRVYRTGSDTAHYSIGARRLRRTDQRTGHRLSEIGSHGGVERGNVVVAG
jgi:hypothetical protein